MNTLMSASTFQKLSTFRSEVLTSFPKTIAGVFVPWAGSRLIENGGLYYVGMATRGEFYGNCGDQSFGACLSRTKVECVDSKSSTPFWSYLNCLSQELLSEPYKHTQDSWGWSNLLKVGYSEVDNPSNWPPEFVTGQREICVAALTEELVRLRKTVIVIVSDPTFDVLERAVANSANVKRVDWNRSSEDVDGVWWWWDEQSKNLYVHEYHPNHARLKKFLNEMLSRTVMLAQEHQHDFSWLRSR